MITRFAPTPSGYLHLGNAVNAQLAAWLAHEHGGELRLRIDDMDAPRARPEYVRDIFDVMTWLGVGWTGPTDPADFVEHHSQGLRTEYFRGQLRHAQESGLEVYACACSRSRVRGPASGGCPGGCRDARLPLEVGRTALRVQVPIGTQVPVSGELVSLADVMGDFVVWRRDDLPAYQLVSVIADRDARVTHVVRGRDLLHSTAAQLFLAPFMDAENVLRADYRHHELIRGDDGGKLSKSQTTMGQPLPRTREVRAQVLRDASRLGEAVGITPHA